MEKKIKPSSRTSLEWPCMNNALPVSRKQSVEP